MNYTPGPWTFGNGWEIRPMFGLGRTSGYAPLAKICGDKRFTNDSINLANAKLMAAAPELFDALQNVCNHFKRRVDLKEDYEILMNAEIIIMKLKQEANS